MSKVIFNKECGCFKKRQIKNNQDFATIEEATIEAKKLVDDANNTWCQKHNFKMVEAGEDIIIEVEAN